MLVELNKNEITAILKVIDFAESEEYAEDLFEGDWTPLQAKLASYLNINVLN